MPSIDVQTLMTVSTLVLVLLGAMFLIAHAQQREGTAPLLWGLAFFVAGPSVLLVALRGRVPDWASIFLANAALLSAYGLILSGVRSFDGHRSCRPLALIAPAVWIGLWLVPGFASSFIFRVAAFSIIAGAFTTAAAVSLALHRHDDPLPSRGLTAAVLAVMGVTNAVRALLMFVSPVPENLFRINGSWLAVLGLTMLLETILGGYFLLSLTKERTVARHRRDAEFDHLTGALGRRAFAGEAERRLAAAPERGALLFFDLDRFKEINDTHGHAVGDRVLTAFADLVRAHLGPDDLFGRWGGEEFVLLLADADFAGAHRTAEEIRRAFSALELVEAGRTIDATVSAGIGLPALAGPDLDRLIASADAGLYAAKASGRDRVAPGAANVTTFGAA